MLLLINCFTLSETNGYLLVILLLINYYSLRNKRTENHQLSLVYEVQVDEIHFQAVLIIAFCCLSQHALLLKRLNLMQIQKKNYKPL
jgi:hypothetical protein